MPRKSRNPAAPIILALTFLLCPHAQSEVRLEGASDLKAQILEMASSYEGQGDPDQSKQRSLDNLVNKLVKENPMPPVKDRISLLSGAWKQVWGPYDYRNDDGGIDPTIGVREIYQVIFPEGYYYNVAPYYPKGDQSREQISLLRGVFKFDKKDPMALNVRFTKYPGVGSRPAGLGLWELAELAESNQLPNLITIVPTWVVKLFFRGGKLEEVYTDRDMRITYGTSRRAGSRRFVYIMTRVGERKSDGSLE